MECNLFFGQQAGRFASTDKALYILTEDSDIYECVTDGRRGVAWYYEFPAENNLPTSSSRGADTANVKVLSHVQGVFKFRSSGKVTVSVLFDNGNYRRVAEFERGVGTHPFLCFGFAGRSCDAEYSD